MLIFEKIKKVLFNPTQFFIEIKKEVGIIEAFKYLVIISLVYVGISMIFMFIFSLILGGLSRSFMFSTILGVVSFGLPIVTFIIWLIGSFIGAGILHIFTKILGGKSDYSSSYKITVYSSTPSLLFGWLPYINILISLYSWYLTIKGLSILHEISTGRAFLVTLIPIIIVVILVLAFVLFFFGIFTPRPFIGP